MAESGMRWGQAAAEICDAVENSAAKIARNAADSLYETVMVSVQDYLRENVELNLSSKLQGYADTARRLRVENEQLKRRADLVEPLVEALRVAIDTFALTEREKIEDPQYGEYIRSIGDKIGYGALMSGAQAEWRKRLREDGDPVGGEFVAGPCYVTVLDTLKTLRAALQAYEAAQ